MAGPPSGLILGTHLDNDAWWLDWTINDDPRGYTTSGTAAALDIINKKFGDASAAFVLLNQDLIYSGNTSVGTMTQTGCISFWVLPGYFGTPSSDQVFFYCGNSAVWTNGISIWHKTGTGNLEARIVDSSAVQIDLLSAAWAPRDDQWYHLELNFDITAGSSKLFVDGAVHATATNTGTRTSAGTTMMLGGYPPGGIGTNDFLLDELLMYNAVQHTTTFSPPTSAALLGYDSDPLSAGLIQGVR
jgi:hypothetical protein